MKYVNITIKDCFYRDYAYITKNGNTCCRCMESEEWTTILRWLLVNLFVHTEFFFFLFFFFFFLIRRRT